LLFAPSHILVWVTSAALVALVSGRRRIGTLLIALSVLILITVGIVPSAIWLLRPLEFQYGRPGKHLNDVKGILVLGGGDTTPMRVMRAYVLAREYPEAIVVYSGGSNRLVGPQNDIGAQRVRSVLLTLGLAPERLFVEGKSRNTWENILFSRNMVKPKLGETWMLATSAVQLPRAMGVARVLSWQLVAWPTDWNTGQHVFSGYFLVPQNLGLFDEAVREWIGLFAYRMTGKAK